MTATPAPTLPATRPGAPEVTTHGPVVMGDGTTGRSRAARRWRRWRVPLAVVALLALVAALASLVRPPTSDAPLSPWSAGPEGSRAVAQILGDQGVEVRRTTRWAEARSLAVAGTTLVVSTPEDVHDDVAAELADLPADVVLLGPDWWLVESATDERVVPGWGGGLVEGGDASCDHPAAQAAGDVTGEGYGFVAEDPTGVELCFPTPDGESWGMAVVDRGEATTVVVQSAEPFMNQHLTEEGNAALALHLLGGDETLVWWEPVWGDTGERVEAAAVDMVPAWLGPLMAQLGLVVVALAVWRGRSFGRVVTEPLPVVVRAAEAAVGRGRLYRRARSRGHAAAALRAGTARRAAARLGLPRAAGAHAVIDALASASGRRTAEVEHLLYGPPPTDDAGLLHLARQLDELESEVHRT